MEHKLFIEPRNIGKSLKIKSLYDLNKDEGCAILAPKMDMLYNELYSNVDKFDKISNIEKLKGENIKTILVDEYFYLNDKQKKSLYNFKNLYNIIAFSTPSELYPAKLIEIIRDNFTETPEYIFEIYIQNKFIPSNYKKMIIEFINEFKYNFITNPDFEVVNTVINKNLVELFAFKYYKKGITTDDEYETMKKRYGHYLKEDGEYWKSKYKEFGYDKYAVTNNKIKIK